MVFEILTHDPDCAARRGRLVTAHGTVETPVFMPVGTQATVKSLTPDELQSLGAQILLGNSYHLHMRPGADRIGRLGGLHAFMQWPRAILTDSGGFQVFSLARINQIEEAGVTFQSHIDGSRHLISPETAVQIQLQLGSDIAMVFDECNSYPFPISTPRIHAADGTLGGPLESAQEHGAQAALGIVQGSVFVDLRKACLEQL